MNRDLRVRRVLCGLVLVGALVVTGSLVALASDPQENEETQSVTGTIASVGQDSFMLTVGVAMSSREQQDAVPRSMKFMIDRNTTIDGKLRIGATADVTYRQSGGNYIAINVRVASRTGH